MQRPGGVCVGVQVRLRAIGEPLVFALDLFVKVDLLYEFFV